MVLTNQQIAETVRWAKRDSHYDDRLNLSDQIQVLYKSTINFLLSLQELFNQKMDIQERYIALYLADSACAANELAILQKSNCNHAIPVLARNFFECCATSMRLIQELDCKIVIRYVCFLKDLL